MTDSFLMAGGVLPVDHRGEAFMTLEKRSPRMESLRLTRTPAVLGELAQASADNNERLPSSSLSGRWEPSTQAAKNAGWPPASSSRNFPRGCDYLTKNENVLF